MRLPLWAYPWVLGGFILLAAVLNDFGKFALARPAMFSVSVISVTFAMRWKLKGHSWFWFTMALLTALHVPLILFIPWTSKWIPALVLAPIGIADLYATLWVISMIGKFLEGPVRQSKLGKNRGTPE